MTDASAHTHGSEPAPCIAVVGPTASGKSELAVRLASRFRGEVVSFDSVQVFRHFDIGTAKIPERDRCGIPHHLLDHIEPDRLYSAGEFARDARAVLGRLRARDRLPVLAGGTGLYLEALVKGLFRGPERDQALRRRLQLRAGSKPAGHLWRILAKLDAGAAQEIHRNDTPKLIRAIEVSLLGGRPMTDQWRAGGNPLRSHRPLTLGLDPPREALYGKIERRASRMFAEGLVEEVRSLLQRGVPRSARPFGALGYAQCLRHLDGACSLDEAVESTARRTRRYAKRQMTWFRRRTSGVRWRQGFGGTDAAAEWAEREFLAWLAADHGSAWLETWHAER